MMKKIVLILTMFVVSAGYCENDTVEVTSPLSVVPGNLTSLELLIQATQQQHEFQVALRDEIVEYQKLRDLYLEKPENKDLLFRVANRADRVLEGIKQAKLVHLFDSEFLKELNVFSKFAKKK